MRYLTLLCLVAACDAVSPIPGAEPFQPPAVYQTVWSEMEACTGLSRSYWDIDWFTVGYATKDSAAVAIVSSDGQPVLGEYQPPNRITLRYWDAIYGGPGWGIVRHEIAHALLRGDAEHRDAIWERCVSH